MRPVARHVGRALAALHGGRSCEALREMRRAVKAQPDDPDLRLVLGDLELEAGLHEAAVRTLRQALALRRGHGGSPRKVRRRRDGPSEAVIRRALGDALAFAGRREEAEVELRRALVLEPDAETHLALSTVCEQGGRLRDARAWVLRALRLDRRHVEARYRLGSLHMWTAPHRAERLFRQVLHRDPRHAMALSGLGLLLGLRGAFREADEALRRAAKAGGAGALPHVYRGHHHLQQGRVEQALDAYREALRAAPGDPHPFYAIGDLHRRQGRDEEARAAYEDALELDPRCGDAVLRLAFLDEDEGRLAEALRNYRRGIELAPQHPWAEEVHEAIERLAGLAEEAVSGA